MLKNVYISDGQLGCLETERWRRGGRNGFKHTLQVDHVVPAQSRNSVMNRPDKNAVLEKERLYSDIKMTWSLRRPDT